MVRGLVIYTEFAANGNVSHRPSQICDGTFLSPDFIEQYSRPTNLPDNLITIKTVVSEFRAG